MKKTMLSLSLLLVWGAATAQESHPDSTDVFFKHLELEETVVTGLAGDTKMKEMPAPVSVVRPADLAARAGRLFNNAFVALNVDWTMRQDRFYGKDDTETATPGYALLGASAGTDVVIRGKKRMSLYLIGTNLI